MIISNPGRGEGNGHRGSHDPNIDSEILDDSSATRPGIDIPRMEEIVREQLGIIGEDPEREGLLRTPHRVAKAMEFLTQGYTMDIETVLNGAVFEERYDEMVIVKDIDFFSMCVPSRQLVNAVGGAKRAASVEAGDRFWTLVDGRVAETTVTGITSRKARELVTVTTSRGSFQVTPDHPVATPDGWCEAQDLAGKKVEWTFPKNLHRKKFEPEIGCSADYADGLPVVSESIPSRQELAEIVDSRFTPSRIGASPLYLSDNRNRGDWFGKHGFHQDDYRTSLMESKYVDVVSVERVRDDRQEPFTVYSFTCSPHPTFLIGGHLTHNCEHHMLPFFGKAHIAYIPNGKIVGLSKIPRIVDVFARRLQVQERMTQQIAETIQKYLQPQGVAVVTEASHMCMMMRGVQKQNSSTTASAMIGVFKHQNETRSEFMNLIASKLH